MKCECCYAEFDRLFELECGKLLCDACAWSESTQFESKCFVCNSFHPIRSEMFTLCKQKTSSEANTRDEHQLIIHNLVDQLSTFEFNLNEGDYYIREHFSDLRRQVQLAKEIHLQQIEEICLSHFSKIERYEKESLKAYGSINKSTYQDTIHQVKQAISNLNEKSINLKRNDFLLEDLRLVQAKLATEHDKMIFSLFKDNQIVKFSPSVFNKDNILGDFKIDRCDFIDFNQSLTRNLSVTFKKFETTIKEKLKNYSLLVNQVNFIDDSNLVVSLNFTEFLSIDILYEFYLLVIDLNNDQVKFKLLYAFNDCISSEKISTSEIQFFNQNEKVCVCYSDREDGFLAIYDANLIEFQRTELYFRPILIGVDSERIFVIKSEDSTDKPLHIFDWNLECVHIIGQDVSPDREFYFSRLSRRINLYKTNHRNLYILDLFDAVCIFDQANGKLIKRLNCKSGWRKIEMNANNQIVIIYNNELVFFDSNGNFLKKVKLINLNSYYNKTLFYYKNLLYCFDFELFEICCLID